jgi:hypothetical protein
LGALSIIGFDLHGVRNPQSFSGDTIGGGMFLCFVGFPRQRFICVAPAMELTSAHAPDEPLDPTNMHQSKNEDAHSFECAARHN